MTAVTLPLGKRVRYALETGLVYIFYGFFRVLPLDTASDLGGWFCRCLGPHLRSSNTARQNIAACFPEKSAEEREKIVAGMWENLGRVMGEYAHLHRISERVEVIGGEHFKKIRDSKKPSIFFSAHIGNWEVSTITAKNAGLDVYPIYRKPNNFGVDSLLRHARGAGAVGFITKGSDGARDMLAILKNNGTVGILMDQKLNEGMAIPFFGRDAMTAPAIAHLALRFGCPVHPAQIERLQGANFRVTIYPPLEIADTGDKEQYTRAMLTEINRQMESWIRQRPEQWLWLHRRWPV